MDLLNNYIEMMGDPEFAIYVASFVFGLIFLIGLIGKLAERKAAPALTAVPKGEPKRKEETPKEKERVAVSAPAPVLASTPASAPAPAPVSAAPPVLEGVMTWEFDDGKKKKNKAPPPPPPKPAVAVPPPAPVAAAAPSAPPAEIKVSDKKTDLPAAPSISETPPEDKTVILPPKESKGTAPVAPATPSPAVAPAKAEDLSGPEKSFVDFQMYETLVRRIAGLEADLKRDPLYLDPLMKRMGNTEKRLEEIATKGPAVPPAQTGTNVPVGGPVSDEVKELKEKVMKLQKVLEQLSEGPSPEASAKTSNYP